MFFTQKRKILKYLNEKQLNSYTAFDLLLKDCIGNNFKEKLSDTGIHNAEIHIDWFENVKGILVQAKYKDYFLNIDIDEKEFSLSADKDESDDDTVYELKSYEYFFESVKEFMSALN